METFIIWCLIGFVVASTVFYLLFRADGAPDSDDAVWLPMSVGFLACVVLWPAVFLLGTAMFCIKKIGKYASRKG